MTQNARPRVGISASVPSIELRKISKAHHAAHASVVAIQDVSIKIEGGEFVSLLGPSGCGKSTLLNLIAGLDRPTSGAVLFNGSERGAPDQSVAFNFQEPALFPWRTVKGNVTIAIESRGISRRDIDLAAERALQAVGLGQFLNASPSQLSGGMKQRVMLARALAKLLATLAPVTDELIVYPFPGLQPGDEPYALAFAVPISTPGLRILCREPTQDGGKTSFDHPLASRFEEMDAVIVFRDVLIPHDRVFLYGDVQAANGLYPKTGLWQQPSHQTAVRGLVKLSLAAGVAVSMAKAIGADTFLHVQEMLGTVLQRIESVKALLDYAERHYVTTPEGEVRPEPHSLQTIRGIMSETYPRVVEIIQTVGAGGLLQLPTEADVTNPELVEEFERFYKGAPGVSAIEKIRLFKLAWDLCGEAFGQRLVQYERYYAGDPVRLRAMHYQHYPKDHLLARVTRALKHPVDAVPREPVSAEAMGG